MGPRHLKKFQQGCLCHFFISDLAISYFGVAISIGGNFNFFLGGGAGVILSEIILCTNKL